MEYDTNKLAQYISDTAKANRIRDALHSHIVLQREFMKLYYLLTENGCVQAKGNQANG
jgi:hypothetical protein